MPDHVTGARIVVFGDIIDDVVAVPSGPIRTDTDTVSSIRFRPGGSAANTASWLGSVGAPVHFIGTVGAADVARHELELTASSEDSAIAFLPSGGFVILDTQLTPELGSELLDDLLPRGRDVLLGAFDSTGSGGFIDDSLIHVIGTMPLSTLAGFGMGGFNHDLLDELVEKV